MSEGRPALQMLDSNMLRVREQASLEDKVQALEAVHSLREQAMRQQYKAQLNELLQDVAAEESKYQELKQRHADVLDRQQELTAGVASLTVENRSLAAQVEHATSHNTELFAALEATQKANREQEAAAEAANAMLKRVVAQREEDNKRTALQLQSMQEQQRASLDQVQSLLRQLTERDSQVASMAAEVTQLRQELKASQVEVQGLASLAQGAAAKVASAVAGSNAAAQSVVLLHEELSKLRERYMSDLSGMKAAQAAAAEAARLKEQLHGAQEVASALVQSRDELRMAANTVAARLAGAEERARQLQSASSVRDRVLAALQSVALDGDAAEAIDSLSSQLDEALAQAAQAANHVATLDATVMQYEAHVKRLVLEAGEQAARAKSKEEHTTQLQRLVAELQAEVQRLQSEASIGAPIVLDLGQGRLLPQTLDTAGGKPGNSGISAAAAAQHTASKLETASTALRVALVDQSYSTRALTLQLATAPAMPLMALDMLQRNTLAAVTALGGELDELSNRLSCRPLDLPACQAKLQSSARTTQATAQQLRDIREQLAAAQVELLGLEEHLGQGEGSLKGAAALLAGWQRLLTSCMAEGQVVGEGRRMQLRVELQAAGDGINRATSALRATTLKGPLAKGDPKLADAENLLRTAHNAVMELSARLPDSDLVSDARLKGMVVGLEVELRERDRELSGLRLCLAPASSQAALLAAALAGVLKDLAALEGIQQMEVVLQECVAAGQVAPVDPVALQGEVMALKAQLRNSERLVAELEATANVQRAPAGGMGGGSAQPLVPLEALQVSERSRDAVQTELDKMRTVAVQLRLRHAAVRFAFVAYYDKLRNAAALSASLATWKQTVAHNKAERLREELRSSEEQRDRLAQVAAARRASAPNVVSRVVDDLDCASLHSILLSWSLVARRQCAAWERWHQLVTGCMAAAALYARALPQSTVAQRLAAHTLAFRDPFGPPPAPPSHSQLLGLVLAAWRMWVHLKRRSRQVGVLSAGMPALVGALGRRRLAERAWLGWRLAVAAELVDRANCQLQEGGLQAVGVASRAPSVTGAVPLLITLGSGSMDSPGLHSPDQLLDLPELQAEQAGGTAVDDEARASEQGRGCPADPPPEARQQPSSHPRRHTAPPALAATAQSANSASSGALQKHLQKHLPVTAQQPRLQQQHQAREQKLRQQQQKQQQQQEGPVSQLLPNQTHTVPASAPSQPPPGPQPRPVMQGVRYPTDGLQHPTSQQQQASFGQGYQAPQHQQQHINPRQQQYYQQQQHYQQQQQQQPYQQHFHQQQQQQGQQPYQQQQQQGQQPYQQQQQQQQGQLPQEPWSDTAVVDRAALVPAPAPYLPHIRSLLSAPVPDHLGTLDSTALASLHHHSSMQAYYPPPPPLTMAPTLLPTFANTVGDDGLTQQGRALQPWGQGQLQHRQPGQQQDQGQAQLGQQGQGQLQQGQGQQQQQAPGQQLQQQQGQGQLHLWGQGQEQQARDSGNMPSTSTAIVTATAPAAQSNHPAMAGAPGLLPGCAPGDPTPGYQQQLLRPRIIVPGPAPGTIFMANISPEALSQHQGQPKSMKHSQAAAQAEAQGPGPGQTRDQDRAGAGGAQLVGGDPGEPLLPSGAAMTSRPGQHRALGGAGLRGQAGVGQVPEAGRGSGGRGVRGAPVPKAWGAGKGLHKKPVAKKRPGEVITGRVLVEHTRDLSAALQTLAQAVHVTAEVLSPRHHVLTLSPARTRPPLEGMAGDQVVSVTALEPAPSAARPTSPPAPAAHRSEQAGQPQVPSNLQHEPALQSSQLPGATVPPQLAAKPPSHVGPATVTAVQAAAAIAASGLLSLPKQAAVRCGRNLSTNQQDSGRNKLVQVESRLGQDTIATRAKCRSDQLPSGTPNLTQLGPAPFQPVMAPLTTYLPHRHSTPGPAAASLVLFGPLAQGEVQLRSRAGTIVQGEAAPDEAAQILGSGNLVIQPLQQPGSRVVCFDRQQAGSSFEVDSAAPVTIVRLPQPVRFDMA